MASKNVIHDRVQHLDAKFVDIDVSNMYLLDTLPEPLRLQSLQQKDGRRDARFNERQGTGDC